MRIINKHITLDEIEIIRNSLDKLHEYHNSKSKFFLVIIQELHLRNVLKNIKKIQSMENTELNY